MAVKSVSCIIEGTAYALSYNDDTGKYETQITAPIRSSYNQEGHTYGLMLRAEDQAGNITTVDKHNATLGHKMQLGVIEREAPVITIIKPGAGAFLTSNTVVLQFDVKDNDSGVEQESISLQFDGLEVATENLTKTELTGGIRCTYTDVMDDGTHTISVGARDNDGNSAVQKVVTFTVDTVPPELNLEEPADMFITNKQKCIVSGTTNDATSAPCTLYIKLNSEDQGEIALNADGTFNKAVILREGNNDLYVKSVDKAGKYSEINRIITYDPNAPIVNNIEIIPNPVDAGSIFKIIVDVVD